MLSPNSNDFFSCNKDLRICNDKSFATIKVVAKNIRLWQSRKSLKLLAAVVTATTKVVVKNIFSNKNLFLATTLTVAKNGFSCSDKIRTYRLIFLKFIGPSVIYTNSCLQ